jgi:Flp pilus assembly protein TadD
LVRNNKFWLTGSLLLVLSACATQAPEPVPKPAGPPEVDARVREPARQDSEGIQVFPLQNPAVQTLLADASDAESTGNFDQATVLLERALRIQPQNPEVLQQMAEVQIQKKDYQQALTFAVKSYDIGPRVGEICSRNWHTISVAREYLNDESGSTQARKNAAACMNTKPRSH